MPKKSRQFSDFIDKIRERQRGSVDRRPTTDAEKQFHDLVTDNYDGPRPTQRSMTERDIKAQKKIIEKLKKSSTPTGEPYDLTEEIKKVKRLESLLKDLR